jgi:hypothetical protein
MFPTEIAKIGSSARFIDRFQVDDALTGHVAEKLQTIKIVV